MVTLFTCKLLSKRFQGTEASALDQICKQVLCSLRETHFVCYNKGKHTLVAPREQLHNANRLHQLNFSIYATSILMLVAALF